MPYFLLVNCGMQKFYSGVSSNSELTIKRQKLKPKWAILWFNTIFYIIILFFLTALYLSNQSAFAAKILKSYNFTLKPNLGHFSRSGKLLAHLNICQYDLPDLKECPFLGFNYMVIYINIVAAIAV